MVLDDSKYFLMPKNLSKWLKIVGRLTKAFKQAGAELCQAQSSFS